MGLIGLSTPAIAGLVLLGIFLFIATGAFVFMLRYYRKVSQGTAIVRNGWGTSAVSS